MGGVSGGTGGRRPEETQLRSEAGRRGKAAAVGEENAEGADGVATGGGEEKDGTGGRRR